MDLEDYKICSSCKTKKILKEFKFYKGKLLLSCNRCLKKSQEFRNKYKCEHGKQKCRCKECGGKSICPHGRRNIECSLCENSSQICIHKKIKNRCLLCDGSYICDHKKRKDSCRECNSDDMKFTIKTILHCSKNEDKKRNLYDEENFIDYDYVDDLINNSLNKCMYCYVNLINNKYSPKMLSIERIDVNKGHIKGNCSICCLDCNKGKVQ